MKIEVVMKKTKVKVDAKAIYDSETKEMIVKKVQYYQKMYHKLKHLEEQNPFLRHEKVLLERVVNY